MSLNRASLHSHSRRRLRAAPSLGVAAGILLASAVAAQAEVGPRFREFRTEAMGRSGVASTVGSGSMGFNPAGLAGGEGGGLDFSANLGLNEVLVDYAQWAADNYEYVNTIDTLLQKIEPIDGKWAPFANTFLLSGYYGEYGVAVVEDVRTDLTISKAVITPVPGIGVHSDFQVLAGRGFEPDRLSRIGVAFKYLYRTRYDRRLIGWTDEDLYTVLGTLEEDSDGPFGDVKKILVANKVAETASGFGVNIGAQRQLHPYWFAGVSVLDLPTFYDGGFLAPTVNLGGAFVREFEVLDGLQHAVTANLDWQMPFRSTPWYEQWKAGVGVEGRMGRRPVSYLGLGLNDGYPTFGVRVGYILYFSYLYTAQETGTYPGQRKLSFHKISVDLGF